jgi:hypothetical protein
MYRDIAFAQVKKDPARGDKWPGQSFQPVERLIGLKISSKLYPELGCITV